MAEQYKMEYLYNCNVKNRFSTRSFCGRKAIRKQSEIYVVSRYSLNGQLLESYPNARIAAEMMNTAQQHISKAAREKTSSCYLDKLFS